LLAKDNEKRGKKKKASQRMSAIAFVSSRFGTKRSNRTNRHGATDKERVVVEHKRGGGGRGGGGGGGGGGGEEESHRQAKELEDWLKEQAKQEKASLKRGLLAGHFRHSLTQLSSSSGGGVGSGGDQRWLSQGNESSSRSGGRSRGDREVVEKKTKKEKKNGGGAVHFCCCPYGGGGGSRGGGGSAKSATGRGRVATPLGGAEEEQKTKQAPVAVAALEMARSSPPTTALMRSAGKGNAGGEDDAGDSEFKRDDGDFDHPHDDDGASYERGDVLI
jgi:hypothetical protein